MRIILASKSPRRKELLSLITQDFEVIVSDADEQIDKSLSHVEQVKEIANKKAKKVFENINEDVIVIGSDTIVVIDNEILGKPKDKDDAIKMLNKISGKTHEVMTGISIIMRRNGEINEYVACDVTEVHVKQLTEKAINSWIDTGKAWDKAGAYAIQQEFAVHIDKINGNFASVMGLPIHLVYDVIKDVI